MAYFFLIFLKAKNSESRCWQGRFLVRPLLGLQMANISLCVHVATLLCKSVFSSIRGTPLILRLGPTPMTLFNLNNLFKDPLQIQLHSKVLSVRTSTHEFCSNIVQPITKYILILYYLPSSIRYNITDSLPQMLLCLVLFFIPQLFPSPQSRVFWCPKGFTSSLYFFRTSFLELLFL